MGAIYGFTILFFGELRDLDSYIIHNLLEDVIPQHKPSVRIEVIVAVT